MVFRFADDAFERFVRFLPTYTYLVAWFCLWKTAGQSHVWILLQSCCCPSSSWMLLGVPGCFALPWRFHLFGHDWTSKAEVNFNIPGRAGWSCSLASHTCLFICTRMHIALTYDILIHIMYDISGCFCCLIHVSQEHCRRTDCRHHEEATALAFRKWKWSRDVIVPGGPKSRTHARTHVEFMVATRALLHTPQSP